MPQISVICRLVACVVAVMCSALATKTSAQDEETLPGIEQAMRFAQDRRLVAGVIDGENEVFDWPDCACSYGGGPVYPPDGYYGGAFDEECAITLVSVLQSAVIQLIDDGNFLNDSTLAQGEEVYDDTGYVLADFPGVDDEITDLVSARQVLNACRDAIEKLIYLEGVVNMIDVWYIGGGTASGAGGSSPKDNCPDAWAEALNTLDNLGFVEDWTQPASTGVFAAVDLGTSSEPPDYYIDGLRWEAGRAKFEVVFQSNWVGNARIYLKSEVRGDESCDGSPVAVSGTYLFWTTASSDEPISEFAGNDPPPFPEQSCTDNYTTGWQVTGYWAICELPLRDRNGVEVCNQGEVSGPPNEETDNPPGTPPPDECGGGGGPGGGNGKGGGNGALPPDVQKEVENAMATGNLEGLSDAAKEAIRNMAMNRDYSTFPVKLSTGRKLESATDLVVPTRHGSFAIRRAYNCDGDMGGSDLLGNHWMFSLGAFLRTPVGESVITLDGWPSDRVVNYTETGSGSGVWKPIGTSNQRITESSLTIDGTAIDVWTLEEPGSWKMHFYREPSTEEEYDGLLLAEEDAYGNLHTYQYALFGSTTQHARLVRILLDGTPANGSGASLVFNWYTGSPDATKGKLKSIQYYQVDSSGVSRLMNQVDYAYCTATSANQEGIAGDLVQVTRHTRLDKAPESTDSLFHPSVTLYRYHNGSEPSSNSDERLMAKGSLHQLKSVFNPEQIEFAAEELVTSGGQTWTADESVLEAAAYIRGLADSASLYTSSPRKVLDYASKIVSYADLSNGKVSHEYLQTSCGCAGSAHGTKLAFSYLSRGTDQPTTKVTESTESSGSYSAYRHTYYDMTKISGVPFLHTVAVVDAADTSKRWVTHVVRDTDSSDATRRYNVTRVVLPSAISTYRPVDDGAGYALTISSSAGIVVGFDYNGEHRITETRIRQGDSSTFSTFTLLKKFTYLTGDNSDLLSKIERYRVAGSTSANDVETTEFEYGFHGSTDKVASVRTISEAELESENGPSGSGNTYDSYELYDSLGYNRWSCGADRSLTYRDFDSRSGRVVQVTRNAPRDGDSEIPVAALDGDDYGGLTVSSWGTSASGGSLTSTYTYDGLGRMTSSTSPGGVKSYTIRERRVAFGHADDSEDPGHIYFYSEARLPHQLATDGPFDGPASVVISNAGGTTIQSSEYALDSEDYDPSTLSYTLGTELSRRTVQLDSSGLVTSTRAYSDVAGDAHSDTAYTYDQLGRMLTTTDPSGTITKNSSFDLFGRVLAVQVGTGTGNMQTIAEYFYDSSYGGSPAQGVGDGLLTHIVQHTGETGTGALSSAESRTTVRRYDWRNRLVITENPAAPHEVTEYDNLGRVTKRGLFSSVPDPEDLMDSSGRGLYSRTSYSQRGMVYRQETAIDASDLGDDYLATNRWFDAEGRVIAEWGPNGPASKTAYDGLGRPTAAYVADRAGDAAPGASGNYADAAALTGDRVAEQTEYRYDSKGRTDLITTRRRPHDSSVTGALGASDGVNTFVAYYYDAADRRTHTVSYGTNTSNDQFEAGGSAPTWPPEEAPDREDSAYEDTIITSVTFSERGLVDVSVDGEGKATKYFYDDLSRRIAVVENYEDAAISWSTESNRWVASGLSSSEPDTDRVTSFVYDAAGNVAKQVAHLIDGTTEKAQVTAYDYGTTVGSVSTSTDSLVASNSLLLRVRYPKEDTGIEAGTGETTFQVRYSYNRLGELRSVTDQNTTRHVYFRDALGRVEADKADSIGSGIDADIERIGVSYDTFGRTDAVTSYSDSSGSTTANQVKFTYSPLWQIAKVYQDASSAVGIDGSGNPTGDTVVVQYAYSTSAAPSSGTSHANYSRLSSLTYPDGRAITYDYGTENDVDDRFGRVKKMTTTNLTSSSSTDILVEYSRIGLDMFAEVDFPLPDVQLDRTLSHDGKRRTGSYTSQNAGVYPGFDRFGRVARQAWADGALTTHSTDSTISSRPPIVEETHTYDHASNRKSKTDARKGASWSNRDFAYDYDGLHRLLTAKRGVAGTSFTRGPGWQDWSLDMLGNWNSIGTDTNGDGDTSDSGESDTRTHNMANELTQRAMTGVLGTPFDFTYDDAGNAQEIETGLNAKRRYTHDAWNRLVKAESGAVSGGNTTWTTTGQYQYNGLHWRVVADGDRATPTGLDQRRTMYYSAGWQLLQEDVDDHANTESPDGTNSRSQEVWGLRYIDDAMVRLLDKNLDGDCRDSGELFWQLSDAQFSTVAVIDKNAVLQERVSYTSYGVGTHRWPHEVNNTGGVTTSGGTSDYGVIDGLAAANSGAGTPISDTTYNVAADLNRDGVVDSTDTSLFTSTFGGAKSALASGNISDPNGPDNVFGYDGYVYNPDQGLYTVRFRWYSPTYGRWLERDPLGTHSLPSVLDDSIGNSWYFRALAGCNIYMYSGDQPISLIDPSGLMAGDNEWPSWLRRNITADEIRALEKAEKDSLRRRQLRTARKLVEEADRMKGKGPGKRNNKKGRRGCASAAGIVLSLASAALMLNDAGDLLGDKASSCHRYFEFVKKGVDSGIINNTELEKAGQDCYLEILERFGNESAQAFDQYRHEIRLAGDAMNRGNECECSDENSDSSKGEKRGLWGGLRDWFDNIRHLF